MSFCLGRLRSQTGVLLCVCVCVYIYIYMYVYMHKIMSNQCDILQYKILNLVKCLKSNVIGIIVEVLKM